MRPKLVLATLSFFVLGQRTGVDRYHFGLFFLNGHLSYLRHRGKHGKHACICYSIYHNSSYVICQSDFIQLYAMAVAGLTFILRVHLFLQKPDLKL